MKKLIFTLVGALLLFVSCQSDDLQIDEALKGDKANVTKERTIEFKSYEGNIQYILGGDGCGLQFLQVGSGNASHIGQYTFVNTGCLDLGLSNFEGVITTAVGDKIFYDSISFLCDNGSTDPCPGVNTTFTYRIYGGTGRFEAAEGTLVTEGKFVVAIPGGEPVPFEATGTAEITYNVSVTPK